jgi:uncharacterized cupin superfamily protein
VIVRWDDVQAGQDIGQAAGALNVSLHRLELAPEETAEQSDAAVEEIVFVLEGSGSWENGLGTYCHSADEEVFVIVAGGGTLNSGRLPSAPSRPSEKNVRSAQATPSGGRRVPVSAISSGAATRE